MAGGALSTGAGRGNVAAAGNGGDGGDVAVMVSVPRMLLAAAARVSLAMGGCRGVTAGGGAHRQRTDGGPHDLGQRRGRFRRR